MVINKQNIIIFCSVLSIIIIDFVKNIDRFYLCMSLISYGCIVLNCSNVARMLSFSCQSQNTMSMFPSWPTTTFASLVCFATAPVILNRDQQKMLDIENCQARVQVQGLSQISNK